MPEVEMKEVTSTNIIAIGYDADAKTLYVKFKSKHTYAFATKLDADQGQGFPAEEWAKFEAAESKGQHFSHFIRPVYRGVKLQDEVAA